VHGDDITQVFPIEINNAKSVSTLKKTIKDENPHSFCNVYPLSPVLCKVSIPGVDVIIPRFGVLSVHQPPQIPIDSQKLIEARHRHANDFIHCSRCSLPLGSLLLTSNISS
jgi:hypothetical protein